jgi:hypothetical protein
MSIVLVDGLQKSFSFNTKNLQPNTIYYFPDPYIVGDNGGIITFSADDSFLIKNESSGDASDQPSTSNFDTKYYGYTSKTAPTYSKCLDVITNFGYIKDSKKDIYGNDYGLFNTSTPRYVEYTDNLTPTVIQNIIFDGYVFYDTLFSEGSAFDYTTEDLLTYTELKRTGLSLNGGNFTTTSFDGTLFFGVFGQSTTNIYNSGASEIIYNEVYTPIPPISPELATTYEILEGGFFINTNNIPYPDAVSSDLSAFEISTGQFYYTDLIEGGINTTTQRALLDALYPALTARFIPYNRYTVNNVDGDMFLTPFEVEFTSPTPGYTYDNSVSFVTELLPPLDVGGLSGVLMIKNSSSGNILPILDTLPYLTNKYPSYVIDELVDSVIKFEVSNSFLFVETYNYLVIEKILFNNGTFEDPKSKGIYVQHSDNTYSKLSNRFKVDNSVYYYKLVYTATDTPTNFLLYPQIYKFDMLNMENRVIFPSPNDTINNFFNVSGGDIQYVMADDAVITHSSRNDIFNISFLLKDQNNVPRIYSLDYYLNPLPIFISNNVYDFAINSMSNIFNNSLPSTIYMYLSSPTVPSFQNTELVL